MNVVFHVVTAIGVAVSLTDTKEIELLPNSSKHVVLIGILAVIVGLISHGALDYIPHCYPINSKIDAIVGLIIILLVIGFANKKYRLIIVFAFLGSVFPDLIDLSLPIVNKQLGFNFPTFHKIFPWHWHSYSGSIYDRQCDISTLNHCLLVLTIVIVCWCRRFDLKRMLNKNDKDS